MPQRLDEKKSIKELVHNALGASKKGLDAFVGYSVQNTEDWFAFIRPIRELIERNYKVEELDRAIRQITDRMRDDLLRIIAHENGIDQTDITVNQKIGEIKEIIQSKIKAGEKHKVERIVQLLRELEPLLQREIDISTAMQHLEAELRKLIRKLEKED
ncbi:hypothetical protein HYY71_03090 [Candidatus Woesearchaeota archaeon]|nr:hypothetical protein [Candidatus Woesearchaeota archaeon]